MKKPRLEGGKAAFATGEAEGLVRELRACLRLEVELRAGGEIEAAAFQARRARLIAGDLASRLERRFERYAYQAFYDRRSLVDDAVAEMFSQFWYRAMQTDGTYEALETKFNMSVQSLIIDAIRKVRSHNDITREGDPDTNGYNVVSLEESSERAKSALKEERRVSPIEPADPGADEAFEQVIERTLGEKYMAWLDQLSERQRLVVQLRTLRGYGWAEVARQARVSVSTAQSDHEQALRTLRSMYAQESQSETE